MGRAKAKIETPDYISTRDQRQFADKYSHNQNSSLHTRIHLGKVEIKTLRPWRENNQPL
jgi:hypothetical protein